MTCNSNCYLPIPPRAWSRVQNSCSLFDENTYSENALVPLPYSRRLVPASTLYLEYAMLNKGNVLQYKKNSSNLTKQQRYAQIAKGKWTNRNTTWATQSTRGYTNPNNQSLQRVGNINITLDGQPTLAPITCPKPATPVNESLPGTSSSGSNPEVIPPPPPPPTVNSGTALPATITETRAAPIVIPDLGNLVCGTQENVCTGELIRQPTDIICHPTSDSDVPGPLMELCWNDGNPTWYPRQRYIMTNSGNKWPVNATLVSAISIPPPTIVSSNVIDNEITLTWTQDERCIPATKFIIYENDIPVKILSGTTFTTTILLASGNGEYVFYIIASNSTIISEPSNSVTILILNSCHYNISGNYSVTRNNTGSYTITFMYNPTNSNYIQLGCTVNNISTTIVAGGGGGGRGGVITSGSVGAGGGAGAGGGNYILLINLVPDKYNIVVGVGGEGSNNSSDIAGQNGGNSYIQNSSLTNIAIAYGGGGGSTTQSNQAGASAGGTEGIPGGGYGGYGGVGSGGHPGANGQSSASIYSGGGGGGCNSKIGGNGAANGNGGVGGCNNYDEGPDGKPGAGYGAGGGGGGGGGGWGGKGVSGAIIFVI